MQAWHFPWSTYPPVILKVPASGYLPHLPFGDIGPLGLHEAGCTLEFHLHTHWLALELLLGTDRALKIFPNYSAVCGWLHFQTKETMLSPFQFWLGGWRICLYFAMDFADDFVVDDLLTFFYFLKGGFAANIFWFGSHSWIFFFTKCGVLELSLFSCFTEFGVIELSRDDFTEFVVLEFFCNHHNPLFLWIGLSRICRAWFFIKELARSCRACFRFYSISHGYRAFSFLADPVRVLFLFCLVYSN